MIDNSDRNASELILIRLKNSPKPLSLFELQIWGVSENAAATRLSELQAKGIVKGTYRAGKRFKEWTICKIPFEEYTEPISDSSGQFLMFQE